MNVLPGDGVVLITIKEAARRLSVCRRTIEREIAFGRFPRPLKVGRASRVDVNDLAKYLLRLREPDARRDHIDASVTKEGGGRASPQILDLIQKLRPPGMSEMEYERLSAEYHKVFTG